MPGPGRVTARLSTPTCSSAPARSRWHQGRADSLLTAKDNVTDGKTLASSKLGLLQVSCGRDWGPGTGCDAPALTSLAGGWGSRRGPLPCWTRRSLLPLDLAQVFLLLSPLAVTFSLGRKDEADVACRGDALTADPRGSGLSRASSSVGLLMAAPSSSSSSSKVAHMAQTGGININSIQISIETELEMEDPMQLKPSSSFPHAAIPSIIPEHFIKPVELGRDQQK